MGMKDCEQEEVGLKNTFPLISNTYEHNLHAPVYWSIHLCECCLM